ncbi:MAG: imelysin family protein [Gammaproteobacteria bacterium]|jgi:putative iron-regulated protein|nr:imelysin family protein [Gammaproteobacteria bacterium]
MLSKFCTLACLICLAGCSTSRLDNETTSHDAIVATYIAIAQAAYEDSLISARVLDDAVDAFLVEPNQTTLTYAKNAWLAARVPYQQTEAFRFGNAVVDEWEGGVNSWPLDEGLIDYTAESYGEESDNNYFYTANIIANDLIDIGGISVDAAQITPQLLAETLHQIDGVESNVATGYHAIEFLLWGQDLNGTSPGAGNRPASDYSLDNCSNRNCDRRRDYLKAVTSLLVSDLDEMVYNWQPGGAAYEDLMSKGPDGGLATMLTGMGSLAYGELAGERIRLGLLLNDPEEEHDCFSDNTHNSHYYDALGIKNVYMGSYERINGDMVIGASLARLMQQEAPALAAEMLARIESTELAMEVLVDEAAKGNTFDVLIASNNMAGEEVVSTIVDSLMEETRTIEDIIRELNLQNVSISGSDSLGGL